MTNRLVLLGSGGASSDAGPQSGGFDATAQTGFTDFSEQAKDQAPQNWTLRWSDIDPSASVEQYARVVKANSVGGKVLIIDTNSDGFSGSPKGVVTWDTPGQIGPNWEVLVLFRAQFGQQGIAHMSGEAASGSPLKYTVPVSAGVNLLAPFTNAQLRSYKKDTTQTAYGAGALVNTAKVFTDRQRYYMRVWRAANRYRAKVWAVGSAEPGAWDYDSTEGLFPTTGAGFLGVLIATMTNNPQGVPTLEYISVSGNPTVKSAPMPVSENLVGGNFGVVDMAVADISGLGFVHYPMAGALAPSFVARGGALAGRALQMTSASGSKRGFLTWAPAGYMVEGDVLALLEVDGLGCGPGTAYPRAATGGFYDLAHKDFAFAKVANDRVDWTAHKSKNSEPVWDSRLNTGVTTGAINPAERWWIRRRKKGRTVQIRAWKFGTAEPGTWNLDSSAAGNDEWDVVGIPAVGYDFNAASTVYLEHLAWTDDPTNNPVNVPA